MTVFGGGGVDWGGRGSGLDTRGCVSQCVAGVIVSGNKGACCGFRTVSGRGRAVQWGHVHTPRMYTTRIRLILICSHCSLTKIRCSCVCFGSRQCGMGDEAFINRQARHASTHAHTHTRTRTHARTRARAHAHTHAHTHTRTHAHTHARTHARTHTHTHTPFAQ